jgi:hypothetical protein
MKVLIAFFAGAALCAPVFAQPLAMTASGEVKWVCGGVGAEERRELAALEPESNLGLVFVTAKRGGYLADVAVSVTLAASTLNIKAEGPYCLLRLPAGRYRIEATFDGVQRVQVATVGDKTGRPARLAFAFPEEPWGGIKASDEEKRQAKEP